MNTELKKQKMILKKKLINNSVFRKTMENVQKHRDIKFVITEKRRNYLVSEPNYHSKKVFSRKNFCLQKWKMLKPVYLGLQILELSKTVMHEFWYGYVKSKYDKKEKLGYMDTDIFIIYRKTDDIYKDIAEDVETRFDISNYELSRPLPKGKNKKVTCVMKGELGEKIMKEFPELTAKTESY